MPEAVEVKLTTDFLSRNLEGNYVTKWLFCGSKYADTNPTGYKEFKNNLPLKVVNVNCKGKFIYFKLQNKEGKEFFVLHSMMLTGWWKTDYDLHSKWFVEVVEDEQEKNTEEKNKQEKNTEEKNKQEKDTEEKNKQEKDTEEKNKQEKDKQEKNTEEKSMTYREETERNNKFRLWFSDMRSFATLTFTTDKKSLDRKLNTLGPDIMSDEFTLKKFSSLVSTYSKRNICSFLMDQKVISGCGNYIKAEVLYMSGISPLRKMFSLSEEEVISLYSNLTFFPRNIYKKTIKNTIKNNTNIYVDNRQLQVYRNKMAKRTRTADGRTTYWFPSKQK